MAMTRLPVGQKVGTCGCTVHRKYRNSVTEIYCKTPWEGSKGTGSQVSSNVKKSVVNTDVVPEVSGKKLTQPSKYMCSVHMWYV